MEYIKKIRELLKDPKKKALTQLGLYAIFFVFVFILIGAGDNSNIDTPIVETTKTQVETYKEMKGYNYKVTYTNIDRIDTIEGTYYNNTSIVNYNNLKYYYEDAFYVIDNDTYYLSNIEYDVSKIFNNNLKDIISDLEEESKTTYKDGTIVTSYTIDSNKIYNYLYGAESYYTNKVTINIKENNNEIHNIEIDLTNLGLNLTKIQIEYSDIDQITSLSFNKDNYTYRESL